MRFRIEPWRPVKGDSEHKTVWFGRSDIFSSVTLSFSKTERCTAKRGIWEHFVCHRMIKEGEKGRSQGSPRPGATSQASPMRNFHHTAGAARWRARRFGGHNGRVHTADTADHGDHGGKSNLEPRTPRGTRHPPIRRAPSRGAVSEYCTRRTRRTRRQRRKGSTNYYADWHRLRPLGAFERST
jgi:hypothetical protein